MQVVEPRREQATEVVKRRREQAAEVVPVPLLWRGARQGGVVEPRLERRPKNPAFAVIYGQEVLYAARGHAYRT